MSTTTLNDLIREGEWEKLKDNSEYQDLPREKKIIVAKQAVNKKLGEADNVFREVIRDDLKSARVIMDKRIKPLRSLLKTLNACYAGALNEDDADYVNTAFGIAPPKNKL